MFDYGFTALTNLVVLVGLIGLDQKDVKWVRCHVSRCEFINHMLRCLMMVLHLSAIRFGWWVTSFCVRTMLHCVFLVLGQKDVTLHLFVVMRCVTMVLYVCLSNLVHLVG